MESFKVCGKSGHSQEICRLKGKYCCKCGKNGHISTNCNVIENKVENKDEEKSIVLYGETKDNENNDWSNIMGLIDTGCKSTIMGEL